MEENAEGTFQRMQTTKTKMELKETKGINTKLEYYFRKHKLLQPSRKTSKLEQILFWVILQFQRKICTGS